MASKRIFVFTAQDGSQWAFAGEVVADNRAKYYAKEDAQTTYEDEFAYTMEDPHELSDWLLNNMEYEDVAPYVRKFKDAPPIDLAAAWNRDDDFDPQIHEARKVPVELPMPEVPHA